MSKLEELQWTIKELKAELEAKPLFSNDSFVTLNATIESLRKDLKTQKEKNSQLQLDLNKSTKLNNFAKKTTKTIIKLEKDLKTQKEKNSQLQLNLKTQKAENSQLKQKIKKQQKTLNSKISPKKLKAQENVNYEKFVSNLSLGEKEIKIIDDLISKVKL